MRPPIEFLMPGEMGMELIYSFVIIACSLMIYCATKEIYELSSYKGIKYFRQAFLFFAVAYFFRYFIKFLLVFLNVKAVFEFSPFLFGPATLFIFMYSSFMAVFYLLYSVMWKKWNGNSKMVYLFYVISVVLALVVVSSRRNEIPWGINLFFFVLISFIVYTAYKDSKKKKKKHNLYTVYMLLFVFWILNIMDILTPLSLKKFRLLIYLASSGIFLAILYKVLKKAGN